MVDKLVRYAVGEIFKSHLAIDLPVRCPRNRVDHQVVHFPIPSEAQ